MGNICFIEWIANETFLIILLLIQKLYLPDLAFTMFRHDAPYISVLSRFQKRIMHIHGARVALYSKFHPN